MFHVSHNRFPRTRAEGFTLIEVAIALVIISLLAVPYMVYYKAQHLDSVFLTANTNESVIRTALSKYAYQYQSYPKPASRDQAEGAPGFGLPFTGPIPSCTIGNTTVCRATPYGYPVLIGVVPFAALGLPEKYAIDGYNNKIMYAVTESLTNSATFSNTGGKIRIKNNAGGTVGSDYHYILLSHGPDNKGAFTLAGKQVVPCAAPGMDIMNCKNTGVFTDNSDSSGTRMESTPPGTAHYDDFIIGANDVNNGGLWKKNTPKFDIFNDMNARIRIGSGGNPKAKLHVMGNMKAGTISTNRLCDSAEPSGCASPGSTAGLYSPYKYPPKVFDPSIIAGPDNPANVHHAGGGINCGPNTPMTGLSSASEECNYFPTGITISGSCPSGEAATGIDGAGNLICAVP